MGHSVVPSSQRGRTGWGAWGMRGHGYSSDNPPENHWLAAVLRESVVVGTL